MKILRVGEEEHEVEKVYLEENNVVAHDEAGNIVLRLEGVNLDSISIFTANGEKVGYDTKKTEIQRLKEELATTRAQVDELVFQKLEEQLGGGFDVSLLS